MDDKPRSYPAQKDQAEMDRKAEAKTQAQAALANPSFTEREAATALVARMG